MKKFNVITLILGCILLAALVVATGPGALWHDLSRLGWGLVPLILLEGMADLCHTAGWRHALVEPHRSLPFWRLYRIRLAGSAINYLTPTASLGGEVAKGTLLAEDNSNSGAEAATGVIVDKLAFALAQLLFTIAGSLLVVGSIRLPSAAWPALLGASLLLALGLLGFFLVQRAGYLGAVARWLAARRLGGKPVAAVAGHLTAVDMAMRLYYRRYPRDLPKAIAWHFAGLTFGIAQAWIFFLLVSDRAILREAVGVCALGHWFDMVGFAIPLDVGIMEGSRILIFRLLGYTQALGLTYGLALRLEQVFWAGTGLAVYAGLLAGRGKIRGKEREKVCHGRREADDPSRPG